MKLEKGMLVSSDHWWYVVVNVVFEKGKIWLQCICDNANNTYSFEPHEVKNYLTLKEISHLGYNWPDREFTNDTRFRAIPYEVITEILLGREDTRFGDNK